MADLAETAKSFIVKNSDVTPVGSQLSFSRYVILSDLTDLEVNFYCQYL